MTSGAGDTTTSGSGDIRRSLELLWGGGEPPSRGPKRGLTLDAVVTAAIELADAEGFDAVSMRRLSTRLNIGTMSLYRYVPGKAELLDLMLDRVQGLPPGTPETPDDWRDGVEALARGHLALYRRHPWLLKVNQSRSVLGPGALRALEAALAALRGMGLGDEETLSVIIAVQAFTLGIARMEIQATEAARETGVSDEEFWNRQEPVLSRAMGSGEFPMMAELSEDTFSKEFDHFGFGLRALVRGFEARVAEVRAERGGPGGGG
ncbi:MULTISPECIES: TetR/AcrR family transcriptional regulator [Streptomyces]|uniref:TetR family transcriptional regulator n=2 Tax=Streptomyces fradiae TaxID=1906 RepID=A0A1Y2NXH6_STRFR|nr:MULTISPECIES: TetR/AcrR family transcriptional regulator [Streptomyces]KAF0651002.1 TetR family transcriptional regulator [Streptomyces fradiae ATCC 10745 = DSM 40063]OSY52232.1 Tetracycline repressor protein class E [Streptomyces fradiae ATCC 10745 = DSM 40063]QEV12760.1 TetR/AcrR family transcriptional regulator [Streptomyces fradiae ATCC 10745 = DSM 40063]UQS31985.1 TetR/AcrR family transcriptional regulator C-terminal domain-containing protein [Streptomyces fradiae]